MNYSTRNHQEVSYCYLVLSDWVKLKCFANLNSTNFTNKATKYQTFYFFTGQIKTSKKQCLPLINGYHQGSTRLIFECGLFLSFLASKGHKLSQCFYPTDILTFDLRGFFTYPLKLPSSWQNIERAVFLTRQI